MASAVMNNPGALQRALRRLNGTVVSTKMNKSIVVNVRRVVPHPIYRKYVNIDKRFIVHDENEIAMEGDNVVIEPCRKLSRHKHYFLYEIKPRYHGGNSIMGEPLKPIGRTNPLVIAQNLAESKANK